MPATLVASQGHLDVNTFLVNASESAKIVHILGHVGNIKALRTFHEEFGMELNAEDKNGQTIVHYAARSGNLGILLYLQDFP